MIDKDGENYGVNPYYQNCSFLKVTQPLKSPGAVNTPHVDALHLKKSLHLFVVI